MKDGVPALSFEPLNTRNREKHMDHKTKLEMDRSRRREADAKMRRDMWARAMKREREFRAQFEDTLAKEAQPSAAE